MAYIDPYYTYDTRQRQVVRIRKGPHWAAHHFNKNYVDSATGRQLNLGDSLVFRNKRDAAIALVTVLAADARKSIDRIRGLQDAMGKLIKEHDIGDCPYLAHDSDM